MKTRQAKTQSSIPFLAQGRPSSDQIRTAEMMKEMGVSKNRGTPKSSILIGFSIIHHPFWGFSHYFWKYPDIAILQNLQSFRFVQFLASGCLECSRVTLSWHRVCLNLNRNIAIHSLRMKVYIVTLLYQVSSCIVYDLVKISHTAIMNHATAVWCLKATLRIQRS